MMSPIFTAELSKAEAGHVCSQTYVGYCYMEGLGVPRDYKQAIYWLEKGVKGENADAMSYLGRCYLEGHGFDKKNPAKARELLEESARLGSVEGNFQLAQLNYYGNRGKDNSELALPFAKFAALKAKSGKTFHLLGKILFYESLVVSRHCHHEAAIRGKVESQYELGYSFERARNGVPMHHAHAKYWLQKAADAGHYNAKITLGNLIGTGFMPKCHVVFPSRPKVPALTKQPRILIIGDEYSFARAYTVYHSLDERTRGEIIGVLRNLEGLAQAFDEASDKFDRNKKITADGLEDLCQLHASTKRKYQELITQEDFPTFVRLMLKSNDAAVKRKADAVIELSKTDPARCAELLAESLNPNDPEIQRAEKYNQRNQQAIKEQEKKIESMREELNQARMDVLNSVLPLVEHRSEQLTNVSPIECTSTMVDISMIHGQSSLPDFTADCVMVVLNAMPPTREKVIHLDNIRFIVEEVKKYNPEQDIVLVATTGKGFPLEESEQIERCAVTLDTLEFVAKETGVTKFLMVDPYQLDSNAAVNLFYNDVIQIAVRNCQERVKAEAESEARHVAASSSDTKDTKSRGWKFWKKKKKATDELEGFDPQYQPKPKGGGKYYF